MSVNIDDYIGVILLRKNDDRLITIIKFYQGGSGRGKEEYRILELVGTDSYTARYIDSGIFYAPIDKEVAKEMIENKCIDTGLTLESLGNVIKQRIKDERQD